MRIPAGFVAETVSRQIQAGRSFAALPVNWRRDSHRIWAGSHYFFPLVASCSVNGQGSLRLPDPDPEEPIADHERSIIAVNNVLLQQRIRGSFGVGRRA